MAGYTDLLGPRRASPAVRHAGTMTSQHQVLTGRAEEMKINAAGGAVFKLDDWNVVRRFLILGTTQGTYYATGDKLAKDAKEVLERALNADPIKFVDTVVEVSLSGSPLKQSPCIFALSLACSRKTGDVKRDCDINDPVTKARTYALSVAPKVLRTFQHTFEFMDYTLRQRGGGSGLQRLISNIMLQPLQDVEYQSLKYRSRVGWTPRDILRYGRVEPTSAGHDQLFAWITKADSEKGRAAVAASERLGAFEELQATRDPNVAASLIVGHRLTHEMVPTDLLGAKEVWEALLQDMPLTALVRNLRKMTQVGLLVDGAEATKLVNRKLTSVEGLRRARMHPLRLMGAIGAYESGTSRYGHGSDFRPSANVLQTLEDALELSFSVIEPLNKRVAVGIDCSGSMSQASPMAGLSAFHAALALAAWYRRSEEDCTLLLFDSTARPLNVRRNVSWSELRKTVNPSGSTNLAAPAAWLLSQKQDVDVLITITDNETWSGNTHYVEKVHTLQRNAKHPIATSVVAVTATDCTVSDPKDPHALDVAGFDATVAEAIGSHVREVFKS